MNSNAFECIMSNIPQTANIIRQSDKKKNATEDSISREIFPC